MIDLTARRTENVSPLKEQTLPLFGTSVQAGFPSPADDFLETTLDLNQLCIRHPAATYFVRAQGDSMQGSGIYSGDVLIVDRSLNAKDRDIVIACLDNEFTVKRLILKPTPQLVAENPKYRPIPIRSEQSLEIFGVVTYVVHSLLS